MFVLCAISVIAQEKYSNEFLSIGVGGQQMGMGNVGVATTDNVYSTYWNPAGLSSLKNKMQLGGMYSEYFGGISKLDYLGIAINTGENSGIALSYIRMATDNIPNTLELLDENGVPRYDRVSSFSASDNAVYISYANVFKKILVGVNAKIIYRKAGDFAKAWGFGIDLGLQYNLKNWKMGLMLQDITTTVNSWTFNTTELSEVYALTGNDIPMSSTEITLPKAIPGIAYNFEIHKKVIITPELDFFCSFDGERNTLLHTSWLSIDPRLGIEATYNKIVFVRAGLHNIQKFNDIDDESSYSVSVNLGAGVILFKRLHVDYAFTGIGSKASDLNSHVISLCFNINKK